jgi:hypothetical protein
MLDHAAGSGRHALTHRGADCYWTPPVAVEALLEVERLPHSLWEPAAGAGHIVTVLRDRGYAMIASDIQNHGFPLHFHANFLATTKMPGGSEGIITNPPYRDANAFVRHAISLAPQIYMLLRLQFLEGVGRSDILEGAGLRAVYVFRKRLPMMHRLSWAGRRSSSAIAFAWFCWSHDHHGPAVIDRI